MLSVDNARLMLGGKEILRGVSICARPGELLALCGPNGAGKSTLLSVLAGDRRSDAGDVRLDGAPLESFTPMELARRRAVMEQKSRAPAGFAARSIVELGAEVAPKGALQSVDHIVNAAMDEAGVAHLADAQINTLSGGEAARVHFARVLAQHAASRLDGRPCALLLDEPTASLDLAHQAQLLIRVRRAAREGAAVVVVLHDLNLAAAFADQIALMNSGRLVVAEKPVEALSPSRLSSVYGVPVDVEQTARGGLRIAPDFTACAGAA